MRGTNSLARVPMEVLVEENQVLKVRVLVHLHVPSVRRAVPVAVLGEDPDDPGLDLLGDVGEMHVVSAVRGALDLETVSVVLVETLERFDEEEVGREPDRASPVGVAAEHPGEGVPGPVADSELFVVHRHREGLLFMVLRETIA